MSAPTLAEAVAQYGRDAYLLTIANDGPHTSFVSVDLKGNVYVCDREKGRVAVFDEGGKEIGEIAVKNPDSVTIHPKTGAVYVIRRFQGDRNSMILDKFNNFEKGAVAVASYANFYHRHFPKIAITISGNRTLVWLSGATYADKALYYKPTRPDPLVDPIADAQIVSMMQGVVQQGTGITGTTVTGNLSAYALSVQNGTGIALNGHTLTLGDGTDPAGLIGTTWPVTSQSNRCRRAARRSLTVGAACSCVCCSIQAATCSGCTAVIDPTRLASHQVMNPATARA